MNDHSLLPRDVPLRCVIVCTFAAFLLYLVAFVTPYWLQSDPAINSEFVRLGLWVACFNGYLHPEDYVSKAYYGCWYIYYPEFYYIREWLNPAGLYVVQMFGIVAFSSLLLATILVARLTCKRFISEEDLEDAGSRKMMWVSAGCHLVASVLIVVQLIYLGVESRDRRWMPKPDHNRLGFSYVLACLANFSSFFAMSFAVIRHLSREPDQELLAGEDDFKSPHEDTKPAGGMFDSTV